MKTLLNLFMLFTTILLGVCAGFGLWVSIVWLEPQEAHLLESVSVQTPPLMTLEPLAVSAVMVVPTVVPEPTVSPSLVLAPSSVPFLLPEGDVLNASAAPTPTTAPMVSSVKPQKSESVEDKTRPARVLIQPTPTPAPVVNRPAPAKPDYGWLVPLRVQAFPPPAEKQPQRLVIPSINVDSIVKEVRWQTVIREGKPANVWMVADYAVGFHFNSAMPGATGNTVMAGHNNVRGQVFRNLNDMKVGDEAFVFAVGTAFRYVVTEKHLIKEAGATLEQRVQNVAWIGPTDDVRLTLISCWPPTGNSHRVIVIAKPANSQP